MKRYAVLVCIIAVALALVTGSIAYFTDTVESNDNVIAAGNLDIVLHETERKMDADGKFTAELQTYSQHKAIYPSTINGEILKNAENRIAVEGVAAPLYNGPAAGFVDKIVTVENDGSLMAAIRTLIAVPAAYDQQDQLIPWLHMDRLEDETVWAWEGPYRGEIDGSNYAVYAATYQQPLQPDQVTPPSLLGFYMDGKVNNNDHAYTYKAEDGTEYELMDIDQDIDIRVFVEAAQGNPDVFATPLEALNTTFGVIAETENEVMVLKHNPWVKK